MQDAIDYSDKVFDIMVQNEMDPWLEDHEIKMVVLCHEDRTIKPSDCAFIIGDGRERYQAVMREEQMYDRIDEQLRRAA